MNSAKLFWFDSLPVRLLKWEFRKSQLEAQIGWGYERRTTMH